MNEISDLKKTYTECKLIKAEDIFSFLNSKFAIQCLKTVVYINLNESNASI